jgi:hypothetical protein
MMCFLTGAAVHCEDNLICIHALARCPLVSQDGRREVGCRRNTVTRHLDWPLSCSQALLWCATVGAGQHPWHHFVVRRPTFAWAASAPSLLRNRVSVREVT